MCVFPLVTLGNEGLKYVFPSKQKAAQQAIALAGQDNRIQRLVIFGSAVTMNCGAYSDLDIAVDAPGISEDEFSQIAHSFYCGIDSDVDLIHYNTIHSSLFKREIDTKGVNVYVRPQ